MKSAALVAMTVVVGCSAAAFAQTANECKTPVVAECRKQLTSSGWKHQLVKDADPKMADASVAYDVWMKGDDAMFCIRSYWRGNTAGQMNCSPLKRVSN